MCGKSTNWHLFNSASQEYFSKKLAGYEHIGAYYNMRFNDNYPSVSMPTCGMASNEGVWICTDCAWRDGYVW